MKDARQEALDEVDEMLARTGLKPSQLAKLAGLASSTLTRARKHKFALTTTTLTKLRDAAERYLAARDEAERVAAANGKDVSPDDVEERQRAGLLALWAVLDQDERRRSLLFIRDIVKLKHSAS